MRSIKGSGARSVQTATMRQDDIPLPEAPPPRAEDAGAWPEAADAGLDPLIAALDRAVQRQAAAGPPATKDGS